MHLESSIGDLEGLCLCFWDTLTCSAISCRTEDLFKQLESRELTDKEMNIIESRVRFEHWSEFAAPEEGSMTQTSDRSRLTQVALQRKMLQEYEKRERNRKVMVNTENHSFRAS